MSKVKTKELKIYDIINRNSGEKSCQPASTAGNACKQAGWLIGDCYIVEQKPRAGHVPNEGTQLLYKVPCLVCPFQYAECRKPATEECPTQPDAPELQNWLKQATQAHLCNYVGQPLIKKDHNLRQMWCPIDKALEALTPKP